MGDSDQSYCRAKNESIEREAEYEISAQTI